MIVRAITPDIGRIKAVRMTNEVTSADGGSRVLFAFAAQWPAAAEFLRWVAYANER